MLLPRLQPLGHPKRVLLVLGNALVVRLQMRPDRGIDLEFEQALTLKALRAWKCGGQLLPVLLACRTLHCNPGRSVGRLSTGSSALLASAAHYDENFDFQMRIGRK